MNASNLTAPLPYRVRESARARRVTLRVGPRRGVEVVVPRGFDPALVPDIVAARRDWLEQQVARLEAQGWSPERPARPETLELRALTRSVRLDTAHAPHKTPTLTLAGPDRLLLSGDLDLEDACRDKVLAWLKNEARLTLTPWLRDLSARTGLNFDRVRIRAQKSRWGSCSVRGTVSLNCSLLFLPRPLARHVLLHELAHVRHMDHSANFHALLAELDPEARAHDGALSAAWRYVPRWLG